MLKVSIKIPEMLTKRGIHTLAYHIGSKTVETTSILVYNKWVKLAQETLNSRRADYIKAIKVQYPYNSNPLEAVIELSTKYAIMIEEGSPSFDMKIGFRNSDKKTLKPLGWYLTIPIRHGTPGSFQYGTPLPDDVYDLARKLNNGEKLSFSPDGSFNETSGYIHKSNIFDGLTKITHSYKKATQSQYVTFRRVSNNSDSNSWIHPGFSAIKLIPKIPVSQYLSDSLEATMKNLLG
jgi:hypothetical protein